MTGILHGMTVGLKAMLLGSASDECEHALVAKSILLMSGFIAPSALPPRVLLHFINKKARERNEDRKTAKP